LPRRTKKAFARRRRQTPANRPPLAPALDRNDLEV
jgi:hypothetical protein